MVGRPKLRPALAVLVAGRSPTRRSASRTATRPLQGAGRLKLRQPRPAEAAAWANGVWPVGELLETSAAVAASDGAKAAAA